MCKYNVTGYSKKSGDHSGLLIVQQSTLLILILGSRIFTFIVKATSSDLDLKTSVCLFERVTVTNINKLFHIERGKDEKTCCRPVFINKGTIMCIIIKYLLSIYICTSLQVKLTFYLWIWKSK